MPQLLGGTLQQLAEDRGLELSALQSLNPGLEPNTTFTVGEVKFPEVDTTQSSPPSPITTQQSQELFKVPTANKGPEGETIFDIFRQGETEALQEADFAKMGINVADIKEGQAPTGFKSKFETGFEQANQALGSKAGDVSDGAALVNQYSPARTNDFSSMFVQGNDFLGGLVQTFQDYINPVNQRTSLKETYDQMIKDSGVEAIDMELVDMKAVIEGTEDDIRREIQGSGGVATESQVIALANSRSKQLIRNYNQLVDLRNSKEKYLQTAIGLEQADRQSADQRFESMFNMGTKIFEMGQLMNRNAIESLDRTRSAIGWSGILQSLQDDPSAVQLLEKAYGLPSGGLRLAAQQEIQARAQAEQEAQLDLQLKQQQIITPEEKALDIKYRQAQLNKLNADTQKIYNDMADAASSNKKLTTSQYAALGYGSRLVQSGNIINKIGNEFASTPAPNFSLFGIDLYPGFLKTAAQKQYEQAKKNFVNAVLRRESGAAISPTEFESAEAQYFPKLGDDAGTLEQKRQNRNLVSANFLREGGMDNVDPTKLTVSPSGELIELID